MPTHGFFEKILSFLPKNPFFDKNERKLLKIEQKMASFDQKNAPFVPPHSGFIFLVVYDPQVAPAAIHV